MQVQILSVNITTQPAKNGKTYQVADVAYKNLTFQGKVEGKKVLSFGAQADTFKALAVAQPQEIYEVEVVKNAQGYNDWVKMTKGNGAAPAPQAAMKAATASPRSTYETPEERARKQVYITRMGSLNTAVATLSVGAKKLTPAEVIEAARCYESFVLGNDEAKQKQDPAGGATGFEDVPDFDLPPEIN